jgi:hypothetical protein
MFARPLRLLAASLTIAGLLLAAAPASSLAAASSTLKVADGCTRIWTYTADHGAAAVDRCGVRTTKSVSLTCALSTTSGVSGVTSTYAARDYTQAIQDHFVTACASQLQLLLRVQATSTTTTSTTSSTSLSSSLTTLQQQSLSTTSTALMTDATATGSFDQTSLQTLSAETTLQQTSTELQKAVYDSMASSIQSWTR